MEVGLAAFRRIADVLHVHYAEASAHILKGFGLLGFSKVSKVVSVCL